MVLECLGLGLVADAMLIEGDHFLSDGARNTNGSPAPNHGELAHAGHTVRGGEQQALS
jgi:hypothetical protein